jgi:hypothetical protein
MLSEGITVKTLGGTLTTISASAPATPNTGDIWIASATGLISQWDGATWQPFKLDASATIQAGTIVASNIASSTITAGLLAAGIVVAGIVDATTITGALIQTAASNPSVQLDGARDSIFGYDASSNLLFALAGATGTDFFSHAYPQGLYSQQLTLANQGSAPAAFSSASVFYSSVAGRPRYLSSAGADSVLERNTVNTATFSIGNTATRTLISAPLNYLASEGNQSSEYEIEIDGVIQVGSVSTPTLTFDLGLDGAVLGAAFTVGGTFLQVNAFVNFTVRFRAAILTTGAGGTCTVAADGQMCNNPLNNLGNANTFLAVGAVGTSKAIDTTANHTFQAYAKWASTNTGQSVTTYRTKVGRRM